MKTKNKVILYTTLIIVFLLSVLMLSSVALAERERTVINNYFTTPTSADVQATADIVNNTYTVNDCRGAALSQAGSNNQMYFGTEKLQASLGLGVCDEEIASSLMFGMRINKNIMLNGSWGNDGALDAFGLGLHAIFK